MYEYLHQPDRRELQFRGFADSWFLRDTHIKVADRAYLILRSVNNYNDHTHISLLADTLKYHPCVENKLSDLGESSDNHRKLLACGLVDAFIAKHGGIRVLKDPPLDQYDSEISDPKNVRVGEPGP